MNMLRQVGLGVLTITALSSCAPAEAPIAAYTCGWQHPCSAQNPAPSVQNPAPSVRHGYVKEGSIEVWSEGNKIYAKDHGQLTVIDTARGHPECGIDELIEHPLEYHNCPDLEAAIKKRRPAPPTPSLEEQLNAETSSIAHIIDKVDQDQRMDDMKRDMQQQLDELRAERDREHMRYLDSESDR
jgi:hypothetical protein